MSKNLLRDNLGMGSIYVQKSSNIGIQQQYNSTQQESVKTCKNPKTPMGQMLIELDFKAASSKHGHDRTAYLGFERSSMV